MINFNKKFILQIMEKHIQGKCKQTKNKQGRLCGELDERPTLSSAQVLTLGLWIQDLPPIGLYPGWGAYLKNKIN